ncbi:MAG: hemerythrin domain-containing protein [Pirellulales bacterium]|nr:hemerythrin domain-containing protein [Pirellulales bacterium]
MSVNSRHFTLCEKMRKEHEALHKLVYKIREQIQAKSKGRDGAAHLMSKLCRYLGAHFKLEDSGGIFDQIALDAPRFSQEIDSLTIEHSQLLSEALQLAEKANLDHDTEQWWAEIARDYEKFSKRLTDHEHQENKIVQQAYNEDIGTMD